MAEEKSFKKAGDKKPSRTCFSCRNQKALVNNTMPCKSCHASSRWKPLSVKQRDIDKAATQLAEMRVERKESDVKVNLSD